MNIKANLSGTKKYIKPFVNMSRSLPFLLLIAFISPNLLQAQFRAEQPSNYTYTGAVVKKNQVQSPLGSLSKGFRFGMQHNYSVNFISGFGGAANVNAYTNIMNFGYGEKIDGQVVLSLFHSPFGSSFSNPIMGSTQPQVRIQDAHFNYHLNDNMTFSVGFSQMPMNQRWNSGIGFPASPSNF